MLLMRVYLLQQLIVFILVTFAFYHEGEQWICIYLTFGMFCLLLICSSVQRDPD